MAVLKLLRNETLYASREAAISGINSKASQLGDGEMWVATYGTSSDAKSIIAVKRTWGVTIFDLYKTTEGDIETQIQNAITGIGLADVATTGAAADVSIADSGNVFTATNVEAALAELKTDISSVPDVKSYKVVEVANPSSTNLAEYKLQEAVGSGAYADITGSSTIIVPKDNAFVTAQLGHTGATVNQSTGAITDGAATGAEVLLIEYKNGSGVYTLVEIPVGDFLRESEFKDGLAVSNAGEVSVKLGQGLEFGGESGENQSVKVKIDSTSENYLTVGANGLKLSGIDAAFAALDATVGSTTVATGKHVAVQVVEADGVLTGLTVTEDDIASAADLEEIERVTSAALNDLESKKADKSDLDDLTTNALTQVVAGNGINVTAKSSGSQTISAKLDSVQTDNALSNGANGLYLSSTIDCGTY